MSFNADDRRDDFRRHTELALCSLHGSLMSAHEHDARLHARVVHVAGAIVEPVALTESNRPLHVALHHGRIARMAEPTFEPVALEPVLCSQLVDERANLGPLRVGHASFGQCRQLHCQRERAQQRAQPALHDPLMRLRCVDEIHGSLAAVS